MIARTLAFASGVFAIGIALFCSFARADDAPPRPDEVQFKAGEFILTGPYAHDNLTIYLIHGRDRVKGKRFVTLQEALRDRMAVVHETGAVNELQIENLSSDADIYIESGDIVKGGRQDRTIAMDVIVPPRSGRLPIQVFCVEPGRWAGRAGESDGKFDGSYNCVAGKQLKIAVRKKANQEEVWKCVQLSQDKLAASAGQVVADARSASSYQLTVENKKVQQATGAYSKQLMSIIDRRPASPSAYVGVASGLNGRLEKLNLRDNGIGNVIGYVTAINGKVTSADVYASHELLTKLWPKLLNSASVEAFAEIQKDKTFYPVAAVALKAVIEDADSAQADVKEVSKRVLLVTRESKDAIVFETRDRQDPHSAAAASWVHRTYLTKEAYDPPVVVPPAAPQAQNAGQQKVILSRQGIGSK